MNFYLPQLHKPAQKNESARLCVDYGIHLKGDEVVEGCTIQQGIRLK